MKTHSPIRETISNDLREREKLPTQKEGPLKENEYMVLSEPKKDI